MANAFATLHVDTGPNGVVSLEMPSATSLRYAGLRFAEHLGLDTDQFRYWLMDVASHEHYPPEDVAGDYAGAIFCLGCEPLDRDMPSRGPS